MNPYMLLCVLYKSSIDIEPLHGVTLYPSNVENYSMGQKLETGQPNWKKWCSKLHIFTHLYKFLAQNSKFPLLQKEANFLTSRKLALYSPPNGPVVIFSKIQNRLGRALSAPPMDRFVMDNLNNTCTIIPYECVKNSPVKGWGGLSKCQKC